MPPPRRLKIKLVLAVPADTLLSLIAPGGIATCLGVEPQEVQKALRHANLRITLETYVHWLS